MKKKDTKAADLTMIADLKESKVDKQNRTITGVVLLRRYSYDKDGKLRREYTDEALSEAALVLEGAPAYLDHEFGRPRGMKDAFGSFFGCHVEGKGTPDAKVVANVRCLVCEEGDKVLDVAENNPGMCGFSIQSSGRYRIKGDGTELVETFRRYTLTGQRASGDLVIDPATTTNLFEQKATNHEEEKGMNLGELRLSDLRESRMDLVNQIEADGAKKRDAEVTALQESKASLEKELQESRAKLEAYEIKERQAARAASIDTMLAESKLPVEAQTTAFKQLLCGIQDDAQVKALIEDRCTILGSKGVKGNTMKGAGATGDNNEDAALVAAIRG